MKRSKFTDSICAATGTCGDAEKVEVVRRKKNRTPSASAASIIHAGPKPYPRVRDRKGCIEWCETPGNYPSLDEVRAVADYLTGGVNDTTERLERAWSAGNCYEAANYFAALWGYRTQLIVNGGAYF